MGLRIERRYGESITLTEPGGRRTVLTRLDDALEVVQSERGKRTTRLMSIQFARLYRVHSAASVRVNRSRRGDQYWSILVNAPPEVGIERTEEPRAPVRSTR